MARLLRCATSLSIHHARRRVRIGSPVVSNGDNGMRFVMEQPVIPVKRIVERRASPACHKIVQHPLVAGSVKTDRQFVAVDTGDGAGAEFLVVDAVAGLE